MIKVQSSVIESIDHSGKALLVRFLSGRVYRYRGVTSDVFEAFLAADSKGTFFNLKILGRYPFSDVSGTRGRAPRSAA